jgi:hypothetical protein
MKKLKKTIEVYHLTGQELAEWLDLSEGRVSQLCSQGVFERCEDGLYDLSSSVINYGRFILAPQLYS